MRPMLERLEQRHGCRPKRHLVDGGFHKNDDTEWAAKSGIRVYGPASNSKHGTDPYAPRPEDGPGVAARRRRTKSAHRKAVYKRRAGRTSVVERKSVLVCHDRVSSRIIKKKKKKHTK